MSGVLTQKLSAEESRFLTRVSTLGTATALPIVMSPGEVARLVGVVYHDLEMWGDLEEKMPGIRSLIDPGRDYYTVPAKWFAEDYGLLAPRHIELIRLASSQISDFSTYLRCIAELHKRRRKYSMILEAQPMPTMVQVSPRALLEFGVVEPEPLASWLVWRKLLYDLDNRSAQETGYLFEPILAAAIGGEPKGARSKVVRRADDESKGRQVDCWKVVPDGKPLAYEFKLRVTIAASGQGRFAEEVKFAADCEFSGAVPVLVVLDPTSNARLTDLREAFEARGGYAYVGDDAWAHLESEAGATMALFIEKYVRQPLKEVSLYEGSSAGASSGCNMKILDLNASIRDGDLVVSLGSYSRRVARHEDNSLVADECDVEDDQ